MSSSVVGPWTDHRRHPVEWHHRDQTQPFSREADPSIDQCETQSTTEYPVYNARETRKRRREEEVSVKTEKRNQPRLGPGSDQHCDSASPQFNFSPVYTGYNL